jgi:hypothetical protein
MGSASATRQKAVATGPVSLTLTNSAEAPIAAAPTSSAATAMPRLESCEWGVGDFN